MRTYAMEDAGQTAGRSLSPKQRALAEKYMPMALTLALRAELAWPPAREDLVATAYLALGEAALRYDPESNVKFSTFARHRIVGALRDAAREVVTRSRKRRRASPLSMIRIVQDEVQGDACRVLFRRPDPPVGERLESIDQVERWLRRLPHAHRRACREIYVRGRNQKQAAEALNCSQARVSHLHRESLEMLGANWPTLRRHPAAAAV